MGYLWVFRPVDVVRNREYVTVCDGDASYSQHRLELMNWVRLLRCSVAAEEYDSLLDPM